MNSENTKKESLLTSFTKLISFLFVTFLAIGFSLVGTYKLFMSMLTSYELSTLDAIQLGSGITMFIGLICMFLLADLREKNRTTAEALLVLMSSQKQNNTTSKIPSIEDIMKSMEGKIDGLSPDISGSISVIDLSKGGEGESIFHGSFNNMEEMQELRNKMLKDLLKTNGEFQGKKMTKEEMLNTMSLEELENERVKAEQEEEWLWAAAIRDKINEKKSK